MYVNDEHSFYYYYSNNMYTTIYKQLNSILDIFR